MVTPICTLLTLSDTKLDIALSVTPEHQKIQIHKKVDLKGNIRDTRWKIKPQMKSVATPSCKQVAEPAELRIYIYSSTMRQAAICVLLKRENQESFTSLQEDDQHSKKVLQNHILSHQH